MNPLDWTAGPFLQFYILLSIGVVLVVLLLRRVAKGVADPWATGELNFLELAYLSGGFRRMADTVMVALMSTGAATYTAKGSVLAIDPTDAKLPRELEPLREQLTGVTTRADFARALRPWLEKTQAHLVGRGLALHPDRLRRLRLASLALIAIPFMLGSAKMVVGLDRQRPIGFLVVLTVILLFVGLRLLRAPRSTAAGDKALEDSRLRYARLSRAPMNAEMSLAFAIAGAAVLIGTPYSAFAQTAQSSGCGGGGGGGCGGGSGGGGGCGGCGGH